MDKEFLSEWFSDYVHNFVTNCWQIAPFRPGNREWLCVIVKAYTACLVSCMLLACVLNSLEGKKWIENDLVGIGGTGIQAKGNSALDECLWFVITTVHGIGFGEFNARGHFSRFVACACVSIGYWFVIFLMSIVMLSNLPGEKVPTLYSMTMRLISACWPSYLVFLTFTFAVGSMLGPYVSHDPFGRNEWPSGLYFMWTTVHRMPYGDMWPETSFARTMTVPAAIVGLLYMPYAMALVAVRCPTAEQHETLLGNLRKNPENALGRGYIVPNADGGNGRCREIVMQEYIPDHP
jgi:hypothetical protein